jgi:hypothetical protein
LRWQSVARVVVALVGIGCAVAVYLQIQPRPQMSEPPPKPPLLPNTVTASSRGTKEKRVDASGREVFSWNAAETRVMADGRTLFKGVQFKFIKNAVHYTVTSNEAEGSGKGGPDGGEPTQMLFRKKVKMVGDDGFSVEAEDATYLGDEQRVVFPGSVVFNRDRVQGRGVGADLYMDRSVLWLNDQAHMTVNPEKGGVPVEISGKRVGLAQADGYIRAEEGARLTRESQRLGADNLVVHFTEGTQSVRRIELVGKSSVVSTASKGQRPDMRGHNIDLDFTSESGLLNHARLDTAAASSTSMWARMVRRSPSSKRRGPLRRSFRASPNRLPELFSRTGFWLRARIRKGWTVRSSAAVSSIGKCCRPRAHRPRRCGSLRRSRSC